jgi:CCR4-NOT complex subunit CAF16
MTFAAVEIRQLAFSYDGGPPVLADITLEIARGSRCLLVGANGAGKTTLLRIVAGKHMVAGDRVRVLGRPAFHDTALVDRVTFLGDHFPFAVDLRVDEVLAAVPAQAARRERLTAILGVDPAWRMHRVSAGQRRRVQLLLGLLRPAEVLLLDEITTDLDLVARADLLEFLKEESEQRGATVLYATHIFDRLEEWATHLALLAVGRIRRIDPLARIAELGALRAAGVHSPLSRLVEGWLRAG